MLNCVKYCIFATLKEIKTMLAKEIDLIRYGNPNLDQSKWLQKRHYLDELFQKIVSNPDNMPPANSSRETQDELKILLNTSNELSKDNLKEFKERYVQYDVGLINFLKQGIAGIEGIDVQNAHNLIDTILFDTLGLITKLKYYYQRPRPYQLAFYYDFPLYYHESITIDSPSYPSGHAYMGRILTGVLGHVYPQLAHFMDKVSADFNYARVMMAVHFKSDVDAGVNIANVVLNSREFIQKHKL